mgnify:CR=1 FL=1
MKTLLRIIVILLLAAIVAGGWYLVANNTSLASGMDREGDRPSMTDASGQNFQPMERDEGGEHGASLSRGLAGVAGTLVKLTAITIIILLLQKGFSLLGNHKLTTVRQ